MNVVHRLSQLEDRLRDPSSVANIDSLLDTVTALIADFDHDSVKRIKNVEAYSNRCKFASAMHTPLTLDLF